MLQSKKRIWGVLMALLPLGAYADGSGFFLSGGFGSASSSLGASLEDTTGDYTSATVTEPDGAQSAGAYEFSVGYDMGAIRLMGYAQSMSWENASGALLGLGAMYDMEVAEGLRIGVGGGFGSLGFEHDDFSDETTTSTGFLRLEAQYDVTPSIYVYGTAMGFGGGAETENAISDSRGTATHTLELENTTSLLLGVGVNLF